jgi:phosphoribosylanthranilate isomerase
VDFLGFVFVRESSRYIDVWTAAAMPPLLKAAARPPQSIKFVGVFRDEAPERIREIAAQVGLDFVQLHGNESEDDIAAIGLPAIKAFHMDGTLPDTRSSADWLMFDSGGGTGRTFDWALLANVPRTKPFFLAGGITPGNVRSAIETVRPDAIDVSSGVESRPGIKDYVKVKMLIEQVRR